MPYRRMTEDRQKRINIFNDTLAFISENTTLSEATKKSQAESKCYPATASFNLSSCPQKADKIDVIESDSFTCAAALKAQCPKSRITVLNFANARFCGGGVKNGSRAQEESLCRTSTLYPVISTERMADEYYGPNSKLRGDKKALQTDALIYSPGIIICKTTDSEPKRIEESKFAEVDVITCAAPNLGGGYGKPDFEIADKDLYALHLSRAKHIIGAAAENGADILILGAFGCGAFKNNPEIVAKAYKAALADYAKYFDAVLFPIPAGENLDTFKAVFNQ